MDRRQHPHDVKQHVQKRFGSVAANYRASKVHAAGPDLDLMVHLTPMQPDSLVLDAGCGAGHTALAFAAKAGSVIACDFTRPMLAQAQALAQEQNLSNVVTQLADVECMPFPARSFDLVVTRYSAHHWLHPERALVEFRRLLKDDGVFIISDIMAREDYAQDTFLQTIELLRDPSHVRDYRVSEWKSMLAAAGFDAEVLLAFDLSLHFATWTRRMATPQQNAEMIKSLFRGASDDIQRGFALPAQPTDDDFEFVIPGAVIRGTLAR